MLIYFIQVENSPALFSSPWGYSDISAQKGSIAQKCTHKGVHRNVRTKMCVERNAAQSGYQREVIHFYMGWRDRGKGGCCKENCSVQYNYIAIKRDTFGRGQHEFREASNFSPLNSLFGLVT